MAVRVVKANGTFRVVIYCRLSDEDRDKRNETDESRSIQNQKSLLIQYALEQGWEIVMIYSDDDYTGADRNRPEWNRLLKDAEQKKFDIVLCKSQARFTREMEMVEKYLHGLFPIWGIRFVSIADNADTENKGNKKSRQINGLVNEWYLEDLSNNIKSVLDDQRTRGLHIGAFALYGYKKDPDMKGHLIIDVEAAAIVREVFTLFSQGHGKTAIARILNDRGLPNPTEYKRIHGLRYKRPKSKHSTLWNYYNIADMLINEMYIGHMVQGKYGSISYKTGKNKPRPKEDWYRVENTHEPIIDRELWDTVQDIIKQRTRPFKGGITGLFARKARCFYCGYTMRSTKTKTGYYLKCSRQYISKDSCKGSFVSVRYLEKTVISEINRLSAEYLNKDELVQKVEFHREMEQQKLSIQKDISNYIKKIEDYKKGIKELYLDKVKGIITDREYMEFSRDFISERDRLELTVKALYDKITNIEERMAAGDSRQQLIEQYTNIEKLDHETVNILIDYILVSRRIPGTRIVPLEIHWNF